MKANYLHKRGFMYELFKGSTPYKNCKACKFNSNCADKKNGLKHCEKFRPKN